MPTSALTPPWPSAASRGRPNRRSHFWCKKSRTTTKRPRPAPSAPWPSRRIGKCSAAVEAIPALLGVIGNPVHEPKLRERVIWALRVHRPDDIRKKDNIRDTLGKVLVEPAARQNNMLRYDCAYMLGMIWQKDAPEATLDVLTEFLKDDSIKIFDRTASSVGGSSAETSSGKTAVEERGMGDGRIMAVDALQMMGPGRYAGRPAILREPAHPRRREQIRAAAQEVRRPDQDGEVTGGRPWASRRKRRRMIQA